MLTDKHCRNAVCPPEKKRARFTDSGGLYLEASLSGSKRWFWKTYTDGKEGRMALGSYPAVGLADARKARDVAKAQIAKAEAAEKAKAAASDGFVYFVQVGAFRGQADADAQRAKLGLIGQQARVSEREQNGRPVYRVRIGPMAQRSEAEALKQQLGDTGIDAALVRIHQ